MTYNNYGAYNGFGQNQGMGYPNQMYQQNPQAQFQQQYQQNPQAQFQQPAFQQNTQVPQIPPSVQQNTQVPQIQQPVNQFEWVSGEMEASSYPLAPGHSVILMDSENPVIYMKTRENNGKYLPMDIYDLVKREKMQQVPKAQTQLDLSAYVRKDDLGNIIAPLIQEAVDKALAN